MGRGKRVNEMKNRKQDEQRDKYGGKDEVIFNTFFFSSYTPIIRFLSFVMMV